MARRNQDTPETIKALILSAAEAIVMEQGGGALTVRKIAARIGYTVGSIYMVFDNMAAVISHINAQTLANLRAHLQQAPEHDVQALSRAYLSYVHDNYQRWRLWSESQISENNAASAVYRVQENALVEAIASRLPDTELFQTDTPEQKTRWAKTLWASLQGVCAAHLTGQADSVAKTEAGLQVLAALFAGER
ncbi:MAG: TetR/AcrR family transcriptional regulator [Methylovulum sp.]|nr:TetR/AcrR family transcriptional regulator [Methylovulum sp.]